METAPCPECNYEISLPNPRAGQRISCPNCGADLEVITGHPLELDWVYTEPDDDWETLDDDWDEDWDDDRPGGAGEDKDEDWEAL